MADDAQDSSNGASTLCVGILHKQAPHPVQSSLVVVPLISLLIGEKPRPREVKLITCTVAGGRAGTRPG